MKVRLIGVVIGLVIFGISKLFFVDSGEVGAFNDKLVDLTTHSESQYASYANFQAQYIEGQTVNIQGMRAVRDQLESAIRGDLKSINEMHVPDDELCKGLHNSALEYFQNSLAIVEKYKEQIDYIAAHNPGTAKDVDQVESLTADLVTKDEALFATLQSKQAEMAKKHDLTLQ